MSAMLTETTDARDATHAFRRILGARRLKLRRDSEGYPVIPGVVGSIEWQTADRLAVYSAHPRVFPRLLALPGATRHQPGDAEIRVLVPLTSLDAAAQAIRARRRRPGDAARLSARAAHGPRSGV